MRGCGFRRALTGWWTSPTTMPGPASLSGDRGQGGSNLKAVRLLPQDSNQTRQTEMKNSPPTMRATAGAA